MRTRKEIEGDWSGNEAKIVEILLDIRDLLKPAPKRGRPRKSKKAKNG
jgi:hypothetical protein